MERLIQIIDQMYAAALDQTAWPAVVHSLQAYFRCASSGLYNQHLGRRDVTLVHLEGIDPYCVRSYVTDHMSSNAWSDAPHLQAPGRIRTDQSLDEFHNQPGYYRTTAIFNEWMKPQDFIYTLGTNLAVDRDVRTKLYLYRSGRAGRFSSRDVASLQRLVPHLINAVTVARRVAAERLHVRDALYVVDHLELGIAFLDDTGRVVRANTVADRLMQARDGLRIDNGCVTAAHRDDRTRLAKSVRAAFDVHARLSVAPPRVARLRRASGKRALQAFAIPLAHRGESPFGVPTAVAALIVVDPERAFTIPAEDLRSRYRLTDAEARLAQRLVQGVTLREAASQGGVTYGTARFYLANIFEKTGTARQSDLVRMLVSERFLVDRS
ncbi:MAG TPA: hypothetical protein VFO94_20325 [Gammaproteobacteria bacterium]|nr:hypothetical protein [Gammaproteobacteria bacterium]